MKDLLLNKAKTMLVAMTAVALMAPMQSCDDDDDDIYYPGGVIYNALVTVKPLDGGKQFYMQLDDYTTVQAINITESPYKDKEVRALANISATDMQSDTYDHLVQLNWIDSIRTKDAVPYKMEGYGDDPVEIVNDWTTIAEDGYLTLRFRTLWGRHSNIAHEVNLMLSGDETNPYVVTFYHDAHGDAGTEYGDGMVAFKINDLLPDTNGETVELTVKWNSFSGEKEHKFKYCSRHTTVPFKPGTGGRLDILRLK